ncbi:protein IQ-DOMAIN 32 [Impatiens glandulifera]|uniref:protein IQ-DOMAIN 32 n=1 Tax=Impatiens glandulifera TaxID=253017 RepID=UPI001FB0AA36|nr:protein IQ-DOMAIN 32 [Impatiens glandulifera]
MGGSAASCLKIIACGCDPVNKEAHQVPSDKRGWSFRKRSARDRVLSNTVPAETEPSLNKEIPETVNLDFKSQSDLIVPDKSSSITWIEEKPALSAPMKLQESAVEKDMALTIVNLDESAVVSVQASIRAILAQEELLKLRHVVKLQAMVRGHLVRRNAVETLRCIQAIIKMQSLVRAHQARGLSGKNNDSSMLPKNGNMETRPNNFCSNKFVCKLLESTPRTKRIYLKCDSSKADSAWRWLERWMSVSSRGVKPESVINESEKSPSSLNPESLHQDSSLIDSKVVNGEPATDLNPGIDSYVIESEENLITYDADDFEFLACKPTSSADDRLVKDSDFIQIQLEQPNPSSQIELISVPEKSELESLSQLENSVIKHPVDDTKLAFGSRKVTNAAFIAAQTKFEELASSVLNSSRFVENSISHNPTDQHSGSECGTELSITSTLDSPIRPEFVPTETFVKEEIKISDENDLISASSHPIDSKNETNTSSYLEIELRSDMGHQMCKSSVEASPRSLITVTESNGTPSSQVSVSSKKGRIDRNMGDLKRRSLSSGKRSPMNSNHDSGSKGSSEQLTTKERKSGKKHNSASFSSGLGKTDVLVDQEPRDSSSSNSLPSYMQATESARAKALANSSPRSSPDVQDITIKKRHSLPTTANGRFGSPIIQRTTSQAQQPSKGNGHPPERKWQR